ncbi:MAG: sulfatase, partial [Bacteroidota bacterium]
HQIISGKISGILCLMTSLACLPACMTSPQPQKPNVVYILTDQWRASAFGYTGDPNVKTPNIDLFAEEAVNFSNAVSVTPVCTPYRASLQTGLYPTTTGMFLNDIYLPDEELCMAEVFKAAGYHTGYLGKWHLDGHGRLNNVEPARRQGFDYWKALECSHNYKRMPYYEHDDPELKIWEGYSPYALAKDANQFLTQQVESENPFLLMVSIGTPHFPHGSAPETHKSLYPPSELILAPNVPADSEAKVREELRGYYAHCTATDEAIGRIFDKLKELNLWENTIIVFTSDHGEMMGAHGIRPYTKQLAWDESIRIPFLISYPNIDQNQGAVVQAPINTPDILPSLLGLAGIPIPESMEGEDLSGLIQAPDPELDRAALVMNICPFTREYVYPEYRAVRTKQYTYVRTLEGPSVLFDNLADPYQMNNLLDHPDLAQTQQKLDTELTAALDRIGDEFQPRAHYLDKWNLRLDTTRNAINYWDFKEGKGVVQTPRTK